MAIPCRAAKNSLRGTDREEDESKDMIMERARIKVEKSIIAVENKKIGKRTENKGMIIERDM
jgi:hypothetical protein